MSMQRWVLVRDGIVRCYLLSPGEPSEEEKRRSLTGAIEPGRAAAQPGEWRLADPRQGLVGDGWLVTGSGDFSPPAWLGSPSRTVSGAEFLALFTAAEVASLWQSGPEFMVAALRIASQNEVNLKSADLGRLLGLAVRRGALAAERLPRIADGLPPA